MNTGDRESSKPPHQTSPMSPDRRQPPRYPREQCTRLNLGPPTPWGSCPAWEGTGDREREVPTCLVYHRGEGCLNGCLAPLCCPDVMV